MVCSCSDSKKTPRSTEMQRDIQTRLNRAIGQLNGVKEMVENNRYCGDVLTQLSAAESAIHRVSEIVLKEHLQTCVIEEIQAGNTEVIDELIGLIHKFK
jgi:DNA-binding FrmR family transcriptional regulator